MCDFFFFKQKTAYEMRISDWSSDVCSSDLLRARMVRGVERGAAQPEIETVKVGMVLGRQLDGALEMTLHGRVRARSRRLLGREHPVPDRETHEIGRASCRERVGQYV